MMVAARPAKVFLKNRREMPRRFDLEEVRAEVEGQRSVLLDLSSGGARVQTSYGAEQGERRKLELGGEARYGWVLEATPEFEKTTVRVRFEEPTSLK